MTMRCSFEQEVNSPTVFWVTKFVKDTKENAVLANISTLAEVLDCQGEFLISIMVKDATVRHAGSILISLTKKTVKEDSVAVKPFAFLPPAIDGANYSDCEPAFAEAYTIIFSSSEYEIRDEALIEISTKYLALYKAVDLDSLFVNDANFNDNSAFCRDVMLYAPTLLVPGWFGIPAGISLSISDAAKGKIANELKRKDPKLKEDTLKRLGGVYFRNAAVKYVDEEIDDVAPWQFSFFRGDDCDGTSMAAYALFLKLSEDGIIDYSPMLVSGYAIINGNREGHSWIMLVRKSNNRGQRRAIMCETTKVTTDSKHFERAVFAWTPTACYAFCTINGGEISLGGNAQDYCGHSFSIVDKVPGNTGKVLLRLKPKVQLPKDLFKYSHTIKDTFSFDQPESNYIQWPKELGRVGLRLRCGSRSLKRLTPTGSAA